MIKLIFKSFYEFILVLIRWFKEIYLCVKEDFIKAMEYEADYNKEGVKEMKLDETTNMMLSEDYKERFKAEYLQLKIRITGLSNMLKRYKEGTLTFKPTCSYELLHTQLVYMECYLNTLEERAKIEGIKLKGGVE
ncbi:crAss001_48 related protein [Clostridium perfringens]|uniref:crAss001_48 related protein n=1 Tax=Clostridium perfringens TaxID=1502 RepID=UPI001FAC54BE|nr:hypothetical protein [Clostridium perfringens]